MKIVFLSNFYNHHQSSFSTAMYNLTSNNFYFIETKGMSDERKSLGYDIKKPEFVIQYYNNEQKERCINLINEADVVIYGSAPHNLIANRLKNGKLTFVYSERIFKKGFSYLKWPVRLYKYNKLFGYKNAYLLCASAFSSCDYGRVGLFRNKSFKWGYFTPVKFYDVDNLINQKKENSILWVARLLELKHPEMPIEVVKKLKENGYNVNLKLVGDGELRESIKNLVKNYGLENEVELVGSVKADKVRKYMEESKMFLFTSDTNEGWGAVLNEAMNSACAVVSSHAIGATPYLIKDKENGLIFKSQDVNDLYNKVKYLLDNEEEAKNLGKNAYETIVYEWNAEESAKRLILLVEDLKANKLSSRFNSGPCSQAQILKNNWYKK